jgi:hypothetical protein
MLKISIFLSFLFSISVSANLLSVEEISELKKPVRNFLIKHPDIDKMEASCLSLESCFDFNYVEKEYLLDVTPTELIQALTTRSPAEIWSGKSTYQVSYDQRSAKAYTFEHEDIPFLKEGTVVILNLNILKILNIPVAFKITNLDIENGILEFSYVLENKSQGIQSLKITEDNGKSVVVHKTRFKSGKKFRDNRLYPVLHNALTDEFYEKLQALVKKR